MAESRSAPSAGGWKMNLFAALVGLAIGIGGMLMANGYFIRSYLLEHPEILPEAMERLRSRESAAAIDRNRAAFETPFHSAWAGAAPSPCPAPPHARHTSRRPW